MKHILEVIQHLFGNYGQVQQTNINEHNQSIKVIFYALTEQLITVFTQIEYIIILAKAAQNPYSDRHLVKISMNIISNTNDL